MDSSVKTIQKPNINAPACQHVTNIAAKVISRAKLSCDQIPDEIMGDKIIILVRCRIDS